MKKKQKKVETNKIPTKLWEERNNTGQKIVKP